MNSILSEEQLGLRFDAAIKALDNNDGDILIELSYLLHFVAMTNDEPGYFLVSDALGEVGHNFNLFYPLTTPLFLPIKKDQMPHYQALYKFAKDQCVKALKEVKVELCENDTWNHTNVVKSLGMLLKHSHVLAAKRQSVMRSQPPFPGMQQAEED